MSLINVDKTKCQKDGICLETCPTACLIAGAEDYPEEAAGAQCIECGHCVAVCPHGALSHAKLPSQGFSSIPKFDLTPEALTAHMKSRRSIREFKDKPIPRQTLEKLLDIARYAPTAVNTQKVGWIVTQDQAKTRELAEITMRWMRRLNVYPGIQEIWDQGREVVLRGAPHVAVAHAPSDYNWAAEDCAIALTYMELAAPAMGLGACWAGLLTRAVAAEPDLAKAISLPEGHKVCGALMLGVPKYRYNLIPPRNEAKVAWI